MTQIVAFTGRAGSGKDTAARAVLDRFPSAHRFLFAGELKRIARRVYGLDDDQVEGARKEVVDPRWNLTPREIMQRIGTEVARSIHADTWVRFLLDREIPDYAAETDPDVIAVITDCRYPNEAEAIRARGGLLIRIVRPGLPVGPFSNHPSETAIDSLPVDHEIVNDGTLAELRYRVLEIVEPRVGRRDPPGFQPMAKDLERARAAAGPSPFLQQYQQVPHGFDRAFGANREPSWPVSPEDFRGSDEGFEAPRG